ncbi:MAG: HD-GYP domain-containing protein [Acidobacteriota bacterium]
MKLQTRIFATSFLIVSIGFLGVLLSQGMASLPLRALLLSGLATAIALVISWRVSRDLARPIRRLSEMTAEMAETGSQRRDFGGVDVAAPKILDPQKIHEVEDLRQALHHLVQSFAQSQADREKSYVEAIGAVVAAVDARDQETSGHSFRVAQYAVALATAMGIHHPDLLRAIEWGALLHDVGKIAVPDAILRKVGPLTEEEWHIMRQHANWGYEILADVQFLKPALAVVYSHHERWDGAGYPRGLAGDEIPLTARIFAVVDTYDAITSERPYRRPKTHREAIEELKRVAGSQLDPQVVEAFIELPEVELRSLRNQRGQLDLRLPSERRRESFGRGRQKVG